MLLNPMQLGERFKSMDDAQLQRILATKRDDATIWPLAAVEMKRRIALRQGAAAGQPTMPQGPTVVEQEMQGLARIAPSNVAEMADGGLAALAQDDDDVPRYNGSEEQLIRTTASRGPGLEDVPKKYWWEYLLEQLAPASQLATRGGEEKREPSAAPPSRATMPAAYGAASGWAQDVPPAMPAARRPAGMPTPAAARPAGPRPTGLMSALAAAPAAPAAPTDDAYLERISKVQKQLASPFASEYDALVRERSGAAAQALLDAQGLGQLRDALIDKREQRFSREEAGLSKERDREIGFALLRAGATMAQTAGPVGKALGAALGVGTESYAAGLAKLKAAQDRINDARDRMDEARIGSAEAKAKARADYNKAITDAQGTRLAALREDFNVSTKAAADAVGAQTRNELGYAEIASRERTADADRQSRERIAAAQAAAVKAAAEGRKDIAAENVLLKTYQRLQEDWKQNSLNIISGSKNIRTFDDYLRSQGFDKSLLPWLQAAGVGGGAGLTFKGTEPASKP